MYSIGDYVVYGSKGICSINEITTLNMNDVDGSKLYYIMTPVNTENGKLYTPVDCDPKRLRNLMTRDEAETLIDNVPKIDEITTINDKLLESKYRELLKDATPEECIKIIKTIYTRKDKRIKQGKKLTEVDGRFLKRAEDLLYSELSMVLSIPKDSVLEYITSRIGRQ